MHKRIPSNCQECYNNVSNYHTYTRARARVHTHTHTHTYIYQSLKLYYKYQNVKLATLK